jgi:CHAT domain-containing protein
MSGEQEIVDEVENISRSFGNDLQVETKIDKAKFVTLISTRKTYNIIHISSHYKRKEGKSSTNEEPVLSDGYYVQPIKTDKGVYYFDLNGTEAYTEDILSNNNLKTDLLVLSGCETAASDDVLSVIEPVAIAWKENPASQQGGLPMIELNGGCYCNSTESFSNLSLNSLPFGAKYTLAFQNKISAKASEQFFGQFYENLVKFQDVPKALRQTKLSFLSNIDDNEYDHFLIILIAG